ncbi:MAG: MFS transporter [Christensenellales bacterium]|jgi:MFS family permease
MVLFRKGFYGWVVVAASAVALALGLGMFNSTNSVFVKPVCDSLGFERGPFTLHRTIVMLVSALTMPFYGRMLRSAGVRRVLLAGALMLSVLSVGYSFARKLWHFYALAALNGAFYNGLSFLSVGVLINDWFDGKKGTALGLAYAGSGLGGAVMIPVVSRVIELAGWAWAYRLMGALGIAILLPVILIFVRNSPSDLGLERYPSDAPESGGVAGAQSGLMLTEAMRTGKFWVLVAAFVLINAFASSTNVHSAPYLSDLGYAAGYVSAVISLFMLVLTVGKIALGALYDRFGTLVGSAILSVFCLGFPIFALLARVPAMAWLYALFVGMASCGVSVPATILINKHFGSRDFAGIFSFISMVSALAASASMPAMGAVYDVTGSYRPAWIAFVGVGIAVTACLIGAERMGRAKRGSTAG